MENYPSETRIILALKGEGRLSLKELSDRIGISKMAVLNHIQKLESDGLVERHLVKSNVGRPFYVFSASENSKQSMASSEGWMLEELMDFLDRTGNGKIATDFLKERYGQVRIEYEKRLSRLEGDQKVKALAKFREDENYFPELKSTGKGNYELLEYNCPIYRISKKFGLACTLEAQLFSAVLDKDVSSTHRQVDGSGVCKFLIKNKEES